MADEWSEIESLAREVASARGARWLTVTFNPEDEQFPWMVAVEEGYPTRDETTYHEPTLKSALAARLNR